MTTKSKVKPTATEEAEKLDAWYRAEREKLAAAIDAENEKARIAAEKAETARLEKLAEDVKPLAIYAVDLAERADSAVETARLALIEWRNVASELATKTRPFPDRKVDDRPFVYAKAYESGLNANGLLKFCRMSPHLQGQTFINQTVRSLNKWLPADQLKRASA